MAARVATCEGTIQPGLSRLLPSSNHLQAHDSSPKLQRAFPLPPTSIRFHAQRQDQVLPTSMSPTITADQWEQRKEEILRLYIDEGLTLKPIQRKLESADFRPT